MELVKKREFEETRQNVDRAEMIERDLKIEGKKLSPKTNIVRNITTIIEKEIVAPAMKKIRK